MALRDRILTLLATEPLDDSQLASSLGVLRQKVAQASRLLESQGLVVREVDASGRRVNRLAGAEAPVRPVDGAAPPDGVLTPISTAAEVITDEDVQRAVVGWLKGRVFEITLAWAHSMAIDLEAR